MREAVTRALPSSLLARRGRPSLRKLKTMAAFTFDEQIAAQPEAVRDVLQRVEPPVLDPERPVIFTGIGTSLHACRIAADWAAELSNGQVRPLAVEAHGLALRAPLCAEDQVVVVSHRGNKQFPTRVLSRANAVGARTVAVTGFGTREITADDVVRTCADERAATHTVSYLTALTALGLLVVRLVGDNRGSYLSTALARVPDLLDRVLEQSAPMAAAESLIGHAPLLVAGFGLDAVTAAETALKLKEGTYLWAEGMSVEAALHGPAAVYEPPAAMIVIAPASDDGGRIAELRRLGGHLGLPVVTCASDDDTDLRFPSSPALVQPMVAIVALQRLVAELARRRGSNPDTIRSDEEPWASAMRAVQL